MMCLAIGVAYTMVSEHLNVHVLQHWAYSRWMPTVAGIGLIPLRQWVVVPIMSVQRVSSRFARQGLERVSGFPQKRGTTSLGACRETAAKSPCGL